MKPVRRGALTAFLLLPMACGADGAMERPGETNAWALAPEPSVDIGVLEGEEPYQLHDVRDVTRLPGGQIAIAHQGSREVRVYDAAGHFVVASGEDGDGPGQWRSIAAVRHLAGDTLLVVDHRLGRYGFVHARAYPLEGPGIWEWPSPADAPNRADERAAVTATTPDAELPELSTPFRNVAIAQEMGYQQRRSYTADATALRELRDLELPAAARLDILDASPTGRMGRIVDTESGSGCMLLYGAYAPIDGVTPGAFSCWEAP